MEGKFKVFEGTEKEFVGTIAEIAGKFNIDLKILHGRLQAGFSIEDALKLNNGKLIKKEYILFKGTEREFKGTMKEILDHFGLDCEDVIGRVNAGESLDEIISEKLK